MSEQDGNQAAAPQLPATDDREVWKVYWEALGQSWRWEPEIDEERQKYLAEHRTIVPDIEKGIYPFKYVRLNRADVEWLLATHESRGMREPVNWDDESQREREGLDLRGADLHQADLRNLPLARLYGSLDEQKEVVKGQKEQLEIDLVNMEGADLFNAKLQGAHLSGVRLKGANLSRAQLGRADLYIAHLEKADLSEAQLEEANLIGAHLEKARFFRAQSARAHFCASSLKGANFMGAHLEGADFSGAHMEGATFHGAYMEGAILTQAKLNGADLNYARLNGAQLIGTQLEDTDLKEAELNGADLREAKLNGADLKGITLSNEKHIGPRLADIRWGDVNLAVVDWAALKTLGDEYQAEQELGERGLKKIPTRLNEYEESVRAYRQLATVLRNQGLNEDAARFAYRAQLMQRRVFWYQNKFGQYLFSLLLDLVAGYGYRWRRAFLAYVLVITAFATAYFIIGQTVGPTLSPLGSVVFSMTSFHGRGFFPGGIGLDDPLTVLAALEAFVGLLIEVTFIATLTQRLFGK